MNCPFCETEINNTQTFCYSCGKSLFTFRQETSQSAENENSQKVQPKQESIKVSDFIQQNTTSISQKSFDSYQSVIPKPENHLALAIICTLFCCMPLGIVSIIYSTQVDSKYNMGQYAEAVKSSESAKKWAIVGMIGTVLLVVLYIIFFAFAVALGRNI